MANPITLMMKDNLRTWFKARGFWVILVAALVPPLLTGAWVWTSQNDVAPVEIRYDPELLAGEVVNITAVIQNQHDRRSGPFNATLEVGFFNEREEFQSRADETFRVPALAAGAKHEITMNWTTQAGTFIFQVRVDTENELREIEENDNTRYLQVHVPFPPIELDFDPNVAGDGDGLPQVDGRVVSVTWPGEIYERQDAKVTVNVANDGPEDIVNATVRLQVQRANIIGGYSPTTSPSPQTVNISAGQTAEVTFDWRPAAVNQFALFGVLDTGGVAQDTNTTNNAVAQQVFVDRQFIYKEPDPREEARDFYKTTLEMLHLRLLVPLVALFYAGSTLQVERERGHLPYLLSRPVPRWMIPLSRFIVSFIVAGAAILVGVIATYFLLLGQPDVGSGFFFFPLGFVLLALFVYGGLFTLVGVVSEKPYLVGLLYVIGFEAILLIGSQILINGSPVIQDWVFNLSLNHWVQEAFGGWDAAAGAFAADSEKPWRALWAILGIGVAGLAGSAWWMKRREFED